MTQPPPGDPADPQVELDRMTLRAGEELQGQLSVPDTNWSVSLQGEEVLSADNIVFHFVLPVVQQNVHVSPSRSPVPFQVALPDYAPPSYASQDLRCQYYLKLRKPGALGRDRIRRIQLSVLPPEPPEDPQPHGFSLSHGPLRVEVQLDQTRVVSGESLTGELVVHRERGQDPLPKMLSFRLAAIEEAVEPGYFHRRVLWLSTHDVTPTEELAYPLRGLFEFPIAADAPFTGEWATFRVHWGFRLSVILADGTDVRQSLPIEVYRRYTPRPEGPPVPPPINPWTDPEAREEWPELPPMPEPESGTA